MGILNWLLNRLNERKKTMAVIYATLIVNGKRHIYNVPTRIREQVRQVLIDLDLQELADEQEPTA